MDPQQFDLEVDDLIEWCDDLDYDKYMDNWQALATSNKTETLPTDSHLQVYHGQLGEISVGYGEQGGKTGANSQF